MVQFSENYGAALASLQKDWLAGFDALATDEKQEYLLSRLSQMTYWSIVQYMRRFPERLIGDKQGYTDRSISGEEFVQLMGYAPAESFARRWLDRHQVATLEEADLQFSLLTSEIDTLLPHASSTPIGKLYRNFNLNTLSLRILAVLVLSMSNEPMLRLMTVAWADFSVRQPTVSFIAYLLSTDAESYDEALESLAPHGALRRMHLVMASRHAQFPVHTPLLYQPLYVDERVISAFYGKNSEDNLEQHWRLHRESQRREDLVIDEGTKHGLEAALKSRNLRLQLIGQKHAGRRTLLGAWLKDSAYPHLLELDAVKALQNFGPEDDVEGFFSHVMREALLREATLALRFDALEEDANLLTLLQRHSMRLIPLSEQFPGPLVVLTTENLPVLQESFGVALQLPIKIPDIHVAQSLWNKALSPWCDSKKVERMAPMFARNYALPAGRIFRAVKNVVNYSEQMDGSLELSSHLILEEIRKGFKHDLGTLADISVSDITLDTVVLTPDLQVQVDGILAFAKNLYTVLNTWGFKKRSPYGNALSILFSGPPGTGKTLLANALANELGKVLYRVDLSRVVDKYIGETEKNLGRIFDEAAKAQAVILFDEADSLFAKRTEVKSSNDRYANLEINYLLQKLESYSGITILTTNLSSSIDDAFMRRIRFNVDFPMPDAKGRMELWQRLMPPYAPQSEDIDWEWLASKFEMSGGYIRNAVLKAAITASASNVPINMDHLAEAAGDEARAMGILMRWDDYEDGYY